MKKKKVIGLTSIPALTELNVMPNSFYQGAYEFVLGNFKEASRIFMLPELKYDRRVLPYLQNISKTLGREQAKALVRAIKGFITLQNTNQDINIEQKAQNYFRDSLFLQGILHSQEMSKILESLLQPKNLSNQDNSAAPTLFSDQFIKTLEAGDHAFFHWILFQASKYRVIGEKAGVRALLISAYLCCIPALLYLKAHPEYYNHSALDELSPENKKDLVLLLKCVKRLDSVDCTAHVNNILQAFHAERSQIVFASFIEFLDQGFIMGHKHSIMLRSIIHQKWTEPILRYIDPTNYQSVKFVLLIEKYVMMDITERDHDKMSGFKKEMHNLKTFLPVLPEYMHSALLLDFCVVLYDFGVSERQDQYIDLCRKYLKLIAENEIVSELDKDKLLFLRSRVLKYYKEYKEALECVLQRSNKEESEIVLYIMDLAALNYNFKILIKYFQLVVDDEAMAAKIMQYALLLLEWNHKIHNTHKATYYLSFILDNIDLEQEDSWKFLKYTELFFAFPRIYLTFVSQNMEKYEKLKADYLLCRLQINSQYIKNNYDKVITMIDGMTRMWRLDQSIFDQLEESDAIEQLSKFYNNLVAKEGVKDPEVQREMVRAQTLLGKYYGQISNVKECLKAHVGAYNLVHIDKFESNYTECMLQYNLALAFRMNKRLEEFRELLKAAIAGGLEIPHANFHYNMCIIQTSSIKEEILKASSEIDKHFKKLRDEDIEIAALYYYKEARINHKHKEFYDFIKSNWALLPKYTLNYAVGMMLSALELENENMRKTQCKQGVKLLSQHLNSKELSLCIDYGVPPIKYIHAMLFGEDIKDDLLKLLHSSAFSPEVSEKSLKKHTEKLFNSYSQVERDALEYYTRSNMTNNNFLRDLKGLNLNIRQSGGTIVIKDPNDPHHTTSLHQGHGRDDRWPPRKTNQWQNFVQETRDNKGKGL